MRLKLVLALSAVITAFAVVAAQAAPVLTIYNSRLAWEAAVGSFSEEDFTGFAGTSYQAAAVDAGDFSVSMSGSDFGSSWHNLGPDATGNNVNGSAQINAATGDAGGLTLSFDFPITAFGGNWQGISDEDRVTSVNIDGTIVAIPNLNGGFWGFTSDTAFTSAFFFLSAGPADGFGIDNVVYSSAAVPEPVTLSLLGLGLLGARLRRRATTR